jgi:hypothetical protein
MLPADHVVTWEEFKNAFRAHHILEGLLERMLNEFLALTQGTHTVLQYAQAFNNLCQYVGYHTDSDAKKCDCFRKGLSTKLKDRLFSLRKTVFWLTVLRRRGRHQLDPLVLCHRGIV